VFFLPLVGYWLLAVAIAFYPRPCWVLLPGSAAASPPAEAATCPSGNLSAVVTQVWDGSTIKVGSVPIQLQGLAAPKPFEAGGERAAVAMEKLVLGREVRCEIERERRQGRCVGVCYLDGQDIAMTMVHQGLARDCPRRSGRRYAHAEYQAFVDGATIQQTYRLPVYCNRL
jgi:endonuclease YncB( thermonuclease family)